MSTGVLEGGVCPKLLSSMSIVMSTGVLEVRVGARVWVRAKLEAEVGLGLGVGLG